MPDISFIVPLAQNLGVTTDILFVMYVENAAWISAKVDFEGFLKDEPEKWDKLKSEAVRKAMVVIKYAKDRKLVDKAHFTIAWIYIHDKEYDEAREHIEALPSLRTNMLQERILDKLALFEGGFEQDFEKIKGIMENSLDKYMEAIAAKMIYDMETYSFKASKEFAVGYGKWAIKVLELFGERYSSNRLGMFKDKLNDMLQ